VTRVVPLVAVSDLASSLAIDDLAGTRMREFIEAGVAKIVRHQTDSGAFALWPGGPPENHLTALALYGLALARQAGYAVPKEPVERGLRSLRAAVISGELRAPYHQEVAGEEGSRAFALYVLSVWDQPEPGAAAKLYAERARLPRYGKAFLARALAHGGGDPQLLRTLLGEITADARAKGDGVLLPEPMGDKLAFYFSSDVRSSALTLMALLEAAPDHAMVEPLVRGLLASRQGGRWSNTQDNFYSLTTLSAYAKRRATEEVPIEVSLGGRRLYQGRVQPRALRRLTVPLDAAHGELKVRADGKPVFYACRLRYAPKPEALTPLARGFEVSREMVDPQTGQRVEKLRVGQTVKVRLTVFAPEERYRVALVDPLPAGLEVVDARLGHHRDRDESGEPDWSHVEAHDDRVQAFADVMWHGEHHFEYLARATLAGSFGRQPTTAEEMYRPEHYARTQLETVEIKP